MFGIIIILMIFFSRDVITVGSATLDAFLETELPLVDFSESPSLKALAIPFGEKLAAEDAYFTSGGNALNAAVTFTRLGFKAAPFIVLGDDSPADMILSHLEEERVHSDLVKFSESKTTSFSVLFLQGGERTIINYKGAGESLELPSFSRALRAKFWYISLPGKSWKLFPKLVDMAKSRGIKIAFNPSGVHLRDGKKSILKNLRHIDFLVLNGGEAAELVGADSTDFEGAFRRLDKSMNGILAVTMGSKGSLISDGSSVYRVGIFKEKKLVDRTGAGDAYGAGFVAGLLRRKERCIRGKIKPENIIYAARMAAANATSVVECLGASEGALYRKEFNSERWDKLKIVVEKNKNK